MGRLGTIESQYCLNDGRTLSGGLLYFYETGTSTPKSTYADPRLTYPNTWPVVLDAQGVPPSIYFDGEAKAVLKDAEGTTLRTLDPITAGFSDGDRSSVSYRYGDIQAQYLDLGADLLPNGKLYFYYAGTSTPKATYSDTSLSTENDWPIVLDDDGVPPDIFVNGESRIVLQSADGTQQRVIDGILFSTPTAYLIEECPSDITVAVDQVITLCVEVTGPPDIDYTYQWYHNLGVIIGATEACYDYTGVASDDGDFLMVEVTRSGQMEACGRAYITIDNTACTFTPPVYTDPDIDSELIWSEDGALPPVYNNWTVLATDGNGRIIANPTGRTIIISTDYGSTWTEYTNSLPDSFEDPGGSQYLYPSRWQYFGGAWRAHLRDTDSNVGNANGYAASFSYGIWTIGEWNDDRGSPPTYYEVGWRNSRYTSGSIVWDENGIVAGGRWGFDALYPGTNIGGTYGNYLAAARYSSNYGGNTVPGTYLNLADNCNSTQLLPLSDGFFMSLWSGSRMYGVHINAGLSASVWGGGDNWSGTSSQNNAVSNGIDHVIIPKSYAQGLRWYKTVGSTLETITPNTGASNGQPRAAWSNHMWMYYVFAGSSGKVYTSYSEDEDGATFTRGPRITLPNTVTSSGTQGQYGNIFYAGNGYWIGWYIRNTDNKIDIFRTTYGELTGNCL